MTALYRKYRPQRFDDVVGQHTVVRTLRNAITSDRVAHAYLFTGTKGTGKTTMAKLLAKAMNCEQGPTPDPCGTCESCVAIAEGRSMDVAEIDAASNRGIDDVREKIIETVAFRPSSGTRRVYILDEAHQLTAPAFNALLKTIEEPPDHVLFAFCTTEAHQMMATVRDRCQRLALAPPAADDLLAVLQRVTSVEKIDADDTALRAVARLAQGSFRNALGTLEMLSTTFGGAFTHADVLGHLGAVSEDLLFDIADGVLAGDAGAVLASVEDVVQQGSDIEQFARELAEHLRCLLLVRHGVAATSLAVADQQRLAQQAAGVDDQRVLAAIDCIADAVTRIRVGTEPRLAVETALVRACQGLGLPSLALRLAQLEQQATGSYGRPQDGGGSGPPVAASAAPATASAATPAPPRSAPAVKQEVVSRSAPAASPAAQPAPEPIDDAALARVDEWWPRVAALAAQEAPLRPLLQSIEAQHLDGGRLILTSSMANMVTDRVATTIAAHAHAVTGHRLRIDAAPAAQAPAPSDAAAAAPASEDEELVGLDEAQLAPLEASDAPAEQGDGSAALSMLEESFGATEVPANQ